MKKKFLTLIFVLFSAIPVFAADWVQLDTKLYIDNSSITKYKQLLILIGIHIQFG